MVDNYHQLHPFTVTIGAEHLIEAVDNQATKVTQLTTILLIVYTRIDI